MLRRAPRTHYGRAPPPCPCPYPQPSRFPQAWAARPGRRPPPARRAPRPAPRAERPRRDLAPVLLRRPRHRRRHVRRDRPARRLLPARRLPALHRRPAERARRLRRRAPHPVAGPGRRARRGTARRADGVRHRAPRRARPAGQDAQRANCTRAPRGRPNCWSATATPRPSSSPASYPWCAPCSTRWPARSAYRPAPSRCGRSPAAPCGALGLVLGGYALGSSVPHVDTYLLPIVALIVAVSLAPLVREVVRGRRSAVSRGPHGRRRAVNGRFDAGRLPVGDGPGGTCARPGRRRRPRLQRLRPRPLRRPHARRVVAGAVRRGRADGGGARGAPRRGGGLPRQRRGEVLRRRAAPLRHAARRDTGGLPLRHRLRLPQQPRGGGRRLRRSRCCWPGGASASTRCRWRC